MATYYGYAYPAYPYYGYAYRPYGYYGYGWRPGITITVSDVAGVGARPKGKAR
jgi:hypothetical protein